MVNVAAEAALDFQVLSWDNSLLPSSFMVATGSVVEQTRKMI
jgi:hypothetical protein